MSQGPFTDEEVTDILRFLGYPDWISVASSIQLGFPSTSQPLFLVRDSLQRITGTSRAQVRRYLCELSAIENQLSDARSRFRVSKVEQVTINPQEVGHLNQQYAYWRRRLADDLGVVPNVYSQIDYHGMGGGINAKVTN